MEVKNLQNQKGFTLVEIAIVLVIIGLLLGGVLKGQELIENSKIKSVTQDFDGISAAYYAYQDRTGVVAGENDDAGAADDGLIDGNSIFWFNLKTEGFIKGEPAADEDSDSGPVHALDGVFTAVAGVATIDNDDATALFNKNYICASNIDGVVAEGLDTKLDDGDRTTGIIRAAADYAGGTAALVCKEL